MPRRAQTLTSIGIIIFLLPDQKQRLRNAELVLTKVSHYFLLNHTSSEKRRSLHVDLCFNDVLACGWPVETFVENQLRYVLNTLAHFPFRCRRKSAAICSEKTVLVRSDSPAEPSLGHIINFAMNNEQMISGIFAFVLLVLI